MEPLNELKKLQVRGAFSHYDEESDVLYVHIAEGDAADSVEVSDDVLVDLDLQGKPLGLTLMNFDKRLKR